MKIIFVLNHFFPDKIAGTEVYVNSLAEAFRKHDTECVVIIPNYGKAIDEEFLHGSIRVIKYAEPSIADREMIMGKTKPLGLHSFLNIVKKEKPGIVHFHELAGSNGITLHHVKEVKQAGFKTVMTFHLSGYSCMTGNLMYKDCEKSDGIIRIQRCSSCYLHVKKSPTWSKMLTLPGMLLYRMGINSIKLNNKGGTALGTPFLVEKLRNDLLILAGHCDKLITLTEWYRNMLIKNNIETSKITVIKQGLPPQELSALSVSQPQTTLRIIFIGRISRFKGLDILIKALKSISGKADLDIYGQVSEADYEKECKQLSAGMLNVRWLGTIPSTDVINTIRQYSILCLPSAFSEMSPLVIQEAFAAGVPVLASDVYGNSEQIRDGENGWLFKFKNTHDLTLKMQQLVDDPGLIMRARKNLPCVRKFEKVAEEYLQIYNTVLTT